MRTLDVSDYPLVEAGARPGAGSIVTLEHCEASSPPRNMRLIAIAMLSWLLAAPTYALGQNAAASAACENAQNTAAMPRLRDRPAAARDRGDGCGVSKAQRQARRTRAGEIARCAAGLAQIPRRRGGLSGRCRKRRNAGAAACRERAGGLTEARGRDLDKAARELK